MALAFPTGTEPAQGTPVRAAHCQCDPNPIVDPATSHCVLCGRYPKVTIAATWHNRARKVAARNAAIKARAAARKAAA